MRKLLKSKPFLIAVIAVVLLAVLALATSGSRKLTFMEGFVGSVVQPVQTFASNASDAIIGFFRNMFNTTDADQENQQLKAYVAQLEQTVSEVNTLRQENERLKSLLSFTETNPDLTYVAGTVIGRNQGIWFDTFTINIGRNQGVEKNMPVVNADGLVGRISDVGATWSKVVALIDSSTNISVIVERTRDNGMVRGTLEAGGESDTLELYYLPSDADLLPGDTVVTSGIGGLYPKGIAVGSVLEVSRAGESEINALVTPNVDFRHIEEIMVIVGMPEVEE
ncbi:MAG: rod shape-determining protein MreC [Eubacteriales bacterium]|nr:rod shape-determining protein MreC [Eubacteriales bacterium]